MAIQRSVQRIIHPQRVIEGADVPVRRYLGHDTVEELDPFLMLDEIQLGSEVSKLAGFPWHPHAGQTTFSYLVQGTMVHEDTLGNTGEVGAGGAQYMEAASGIEHQEIPGLSPQGFWGFQLWINLDHKARLLEPSYQNISSEQIAVSQSPGVLVRHVAGPHGAVQKPCRNLIFLDISMDPGAKWEYSLPSSHCAWLLGLTGMVDIVGSNGGHLLKPQELAVLNHGDQLKVVANGSSVARFLLVSGEPVKESVFWYGPFVARTSEEMRALVQRMR